VYELHHVAGSDYADLAWVVSREFRLQPSGERVALLDEVFQQYRSSAGTVSLEWDNWTEFTVVAEDARSETLVQAIGAFLGSNAAVDRFLRPG
jgi:hypothetical protein